MSAGDSWQSSSRPTSLGEDVARERHFVLCTAWERDVDVVAHPLRVLRLVVVVTVVVVVVQVAGTVEEVDVVVRRRGQEQLGPGFQG